MPRLSQVVAARTHKTKPILTELTRIANTFGKGALFSGRDRRYVPKNEDGEERLPETQTVQFKAGDLLTDIVAHGADLLDLNFTNDFGNAEARADVVVDGVVLLENAPVTALMSLEKNLIEIRQTLAAAPVNSTTETWSYDDDNGVYVTDETASLSTAKVLTPIVLFPATPEHPAQTQLVSEDVTVGTWYTRLRSGAMSSSGKRSILERMDTLIGAVRHAREEANSTEVPPIKAGKKLLDWVISASR